MTTPTTHASLDVIAPLTSAFERVKTMLFRPFDPSKWLAVAFCAWLACLGEGGFGGGFNFNFPGNRHRFHRDLDGVKDFVVRNLHWLIPLAVVLVIVGIAVWLLFTWLSSRGRFMFLHCVAHNVAEIGVPWTRFARQGDSLFCFRVILCLVSLLLAAPVLVLGGLAVAAMVHAGEPSVRGVLILVGALLVLFALMLVLVVIAKFLTDFVIPIMFLRGTAVGAGWREFLGLLSVNKANLLLYLLFQIVIKLAIGIVVIAAIVATCCCAGCLMALPYVGTVALLPILVFERSYSAYYLAQLGPDYDVFAPAPGTSPPLNAAA